MKDVTSAACVDTDKPIHLDWLQTNVTGTIQTYVSAAYGDRYPYAALFRYNGIVDATSSSRLSTKFELIPGPQNGFPENVVQLKMVEVGGAVHVVAVKAGKCPTSTTVADGTMVYVIGPDGVLKREHGLPECHPVDMAIL